MTVEWLALIVAGLALAVSVVSAFIAWSSAHHAKRQADAATGSLPPTLGLHQRQMEHPYEDRLIVTATLTNFNRQPVHVLGWQIDVDEGLVVSEYGSQTTLEAVAHALRKGTRQFDPPLRIDGSHPVSAPPSQEWQFRVADPENLAEPSAATAEVTVSYRFEGSGDHHVLRSSLSLKLPTDWQ